MKRILIVEDEAAIREFEAINLKRVGYNVAEAGSGEEALDIYDNDVEGFDIALLDISMPGMDGFALCKELRKRSETLGIIMLTARTQEMDKISGLMMGADDYITKPFSPTELLARVDSLYRRVEMHSAKQAVASSDDITLGEFTLNLRRRTLLKSGVNIELTQVEFQMIEYFFNNPDTALDLTDILNKVWGSNYFGEEKIVDVNIRRSRKKTNIEEEEVKPQIPAIITAREKMAQLKESNLWQSGKYKDYYTDLTGIAREYLEGQFNIDAIEMTSDEILDEVRKIQLDNLIFSKLQNTLITSDLVKFAKATPSPAENENAFKDINSFIEESFVFHQEQEKKKAEEAKAKKYDFEEDKNQEMEETK